jgi:hypothetical protein
MEAVTAKGTVAFAKRGLRLRERAHHRVMHVRKGLLVLFRELLRDVAELGEVFVVDLALDRRTREKIWINTSR